MTDENRPRLAKGTNLTQLVPLLKKRRRVRPFGPLSPAAERLMQERILDHAWYPHAPFMELLRVMYREVLGSNEDNAMSMGIAAGKIVLQGVHKTFVIAGEPVASAMAMRHSWRAYFNFGELKAVCDDGRSVTLTLTGYPDVPPVHGGMIVGWAVAAAQLGGAPGAQGEILESPGTAARGWFTECASEVSAPRCDPRRAMRGPSAKTRTTQWPLTSRNH